MTGFRLLRFYPDNARSGDRETQQTSLFNSSFDTQKFYEREFVFAKGHKHPSASSYSLIIGNNGAGKSRLLRDIARTFIGLEKRRRQFPARLIEYEYAGSKWRITRSGERVSLYINDVLAEYETANIRIPSRIIALTMTPFDKFPVNRSIFPHRVSESDEISNYKYLGLRDGTNRFSPRALMHRAIENLFETVWESDHLHRPSIGDVLSFLSYKPLIEIKYYLRPINIDSYLSGDRGTVVAHRLNKLISQGRVTHGSVADSIGYFSQYGFRHELDVRIDFDNWDISAPKWLLKNLYELGRIGLVSVRSLKMMKIDDVPIDIMGASSGEISIFLSFLAIASVMRDESLVLIDEPELSLHPEWQSKYIELLSSAFSSYRGSHFMISTHSPLVLSDIDASLTEVTYMDKDIALTPDEVEGESPDYLLARAFRVPAKNNQYIKNEIVHLLRMAADGLVADPSYISRVQDLIALAPRLSARNPALAKLIFGLQKAKRAEG